MCSAIAKITLSCVFFALVNCVQADEATAVLERAIQAHGGAERLERTKRGHIKAEWKGQSLGNTLQMTWEVTFDLPKRYKRKMVGTKGGKALDGESAVMGTKGWSRQGQDPPQEDTAVMVHPLEDHWHAILAQLLHLRSKDTELKILAEETKGGRRLVGIRFASPRAAADLYFDKTTGLLARRQWPLPHPFFNADTILYGDYREVGGVHYPMHWEGTLNNTSSLDIRIISLDFLDKIDESAFAKPAVSHPWEPPAPPDMPSTPSAEAPACWDIRLIVATLAVGCFVAVVWLIVRGSKAKKQTAPPQ
jgi:hypothetical protein